MILSIGAVLLLACSTVVFGQNGPPPAGQVIDAQPQRPNLLRELGLSQDQVRQIRMMNAERKPLMEAAQRRLREANRDLDIAIYSDTVDDGLVGERLKQFQAAQAEVSKLRFQSELELRRLLTPDQLTKFRELRRRFAQVRDDLQERRQRRNRRLQQRRPVPNQNPPPIDF